MAGIKDYSTTQINNSDLNGISVAEGMLPSNLNNAIRALMKNTREWFNDSQWVEYGDGDGAYTAAYASATSFTIAGVDVTPIYHEGRRIKLTATTPGTIYGTISSSSFSTNTTINVTWDSGSLSNEAIDNVYIGALSKTNNSLPTGVIATATLADGSVTTIKIADSAVTTAKINDAAVTNAKLGADSVDGSKIADDSIDSEHYVDGSIDTAHIADSQITTAKIANLNVTTAKIADSNVTTAKIADSNVTTVKIADLNVTTGKIAADAVDGTKIADDSIDSEHYVDGSIDTQHIADSQITTAKVADSNITTAKIADSNVTTAKIADSNITTAKINNDAVTIDKIADAVIVTNAEASGHTPDDVTFLTTSASDSLYFRQDSSETIDSGDTWSGSDSYIATTAAIDARIIDLVDDVGGFFPIANETNFPNTNPDVNDGAGTIVSIKEMATTRTPSGGTVTIAGGTVGGSTVTITGCGSTVLTAGFGVLVETSSTLNTYTFHRLVPKATEVTTVAAISSDITAVAGITSDVTSVAAIDTDVSSVAAIDTNVTTVAGSIANVNTTASNITDVNTFAVRYRIGATNPTTSLDEGDLFYNTTDNELKFYNGSAWSTIQGGISNVVDDVTPQLGGNLDLNSNDITGTGNINITGTIESSGNITGTLATASQPNITSVGTLTSFTSTGIDDNATSTAITIDSSDNSIFSGTIFNSGAIYNSANNGLTLLSGGNLANAGANLTLYGGSHSSDADEFRFRTGSTERMRLNATGLGIGTSSPVRPLHISSGASTSLQLERTASGTEGKLILQSATSFNALYSKDGSDSNKDFAIFTGANERMRINSSGNVGIGTSSPSASYKLDVSGAIRGTALRVYDTTPSLTIHSSDTSLGSNDSIGALYFNTSDSTTPGGGGIVSTIETYSTTSNGSDYALKISKREGSGGGECSINMGGSSTGDIRFGTNTSGNATTRMTIAKDGNVGIGTSSPEGKLHIQVDNVGTPSTDADDLVIEKTVDTGLSILSTTTGRIFFGDASDNDVGRIVYVHTDNSMRFNTNAAESMRIDSSGNVGIGTSSPSQKLDVVGSIEVSDGIYIGGTGTANKLDDYEEGLHTVTATDTGGGATITMDTSYDQLAYTKIGRVVHIQGVLLFSSISGTFSGTLQISLPFTASNLTDLAGRTIMGLGTYNVDYTAGTAPYLSIGEGNAHATIQTSGDNIGGGNGQPQGSGQLYIGGSYITDA